MTSINLKSKSIFFALGVLAGTLFIATTASSEDAATRDFVNQVSKTIIPVAVDTQAGSLPKSATSDDGKLTISVNLAELKSGDSLVVTAAVREKGFLRIFSQTESGSVTQIFPNLFQQDNAINEQAVTIPGPSAPFRFDVQPPFGAEGLLVIFSPVQLGDSENLDFKNEGIFKSFKTLDDFRASLTKSIKVVPTGVSAISHVKLQIQTSER